ncbi:MAG TPA: hypothetical protein DDY49_14250 [Paenibacillaceae bacterium]|nr:hypothetical protein [Paenibacillaceae bacterium]
MKKNLFFLLLFIPLLSGCLYPKERLAENTTPPVQQIQQVQEAVKKFQEKTGVLPLLNRDASTPIYEKYPIDFQKLVPGYLSTIPGAAFEAGGNYMFVFINPEEKLEVRLADLVVSQKIQSLQQDVQLYYTRNKSYPFGEKIVDGYYLLDFKAFNQEDETVTSQYSQQHLNIIISEKGIVGVDYAPDIQMAVQKLSTPPGPIEDLRTYLAVDSPVVPIKSFPYLLINGEPHLMKVYN